MKPMKTLPIVTAALTFLAGLAGPERTGAAQGAGGPGAGSARPQKESPFACDRLALSPAERKRHFEELGPALRAKKTGVQELSDGYEFAFPSDASTFQLVAEWSIQERRCCPFFDIALRLEREGGPLTLRLTGRPGTKEFIKADAAAWIAK